MHYPEWLLLVSGLMEDTPIGQTVLIRKEKRRERLKHFTPHENRIRNEWQRFRAEQMRAEHSPADTAEYFEKLFAKMFA